MATKRGRIVAYLDGLLPATWLFDHVVIQDLETN